MKIVDHKGLITTDGPHPLTPDELEDIARRREAARERAKALPDDDDREVGEVDPDNLPMTEEELATMRPAHEVHPEIIAARLRSDSRPPSKGSQDPG